MNRQRSKAPAFIDTARKILLVLALALTGVGFSAAAHAVDEDAGSQFELYGNVKYNNDGLPGVRILVEGPNFAAEVVTDERGQFALPVPDGGVYLLTLFEDTLPEGIAVIDGGNVQEVEFGFTRSVVKNFFLGEGQRTPVIFIDQLLMRVISGLNFGLLLGLAAIGLSLVFGTTALPNFAHGEMVTFGAVAALYLTLMGTPVLLAFALAVILSAGFGWAFNAGVFAPLRHRGIGIVQMMIVSIGLSLTIRYIFQFLRGGGTEQLPGATGAPAITLFRTVQLSVNDMLSMSVSLVVVLLVGWWLVSSKMGKATRAVSDNASLAAASGIDVDRVVRVVWVLSGALAGLAGIMWAYFRPGVKWDMGEKILLFIFAAGVLGGLGTAFGSLIGAIIVGVFIETSALFIPSDLKYVGALFIMIVVLLFRPQGILGKRERIG